MRSPFLKTYLALAVALALGGYVYWSEKKKPAAPEDDKPRVLTLEAAKVRQVELSPRDGEATRLTKEGTSWVVSAPAPAPADQAEVESLLRNLESLRVEEVVSEAPASLGDFGLETPRTVVSAWTEGAAEPQKVLLGDKTPDGSGVYAKLPAAPRVFAVGSFLGAAFEKKPFDLRDRTVLRFPRDAVKTLSVTGPEGAYALARDERGEWAFTAPLKTRAGRWAVDGLLGTLEGLRMESIATAEAGGAGALKAYGLDRPARTVVLGLADGGTRTLEVGSEAGEKKHHVRDASGPMVVVVPGTLVEELAKGMAELRSKRVLDVATYEVEGFDVEADGAQRVHARTTAKGKDGTETTTWKRTAPEAKDLETSKVQDALFAVGGAEVTGFVDAPAAPGTYGLDAPALRVTIRYSGGKPPVFFELGTKDGAWFARRSDDAAVLRLEAEKAEELRKAFREL